MWLETEGKLTTPTETTIQLAEKFCDVSIDSKGRKSFEFDSHGLAEFVAAVKAQCADLCDSMHGERNGDCAIAIRERHNAEITGG